MKNIWNLPNALTILRMALVPTFVCLIYSKVNHANVWAMILFIIAAVTDLVDGYIARKYNLITDFGKVWDPVADKVMVAAGFIVLVDLHRLEAWVAIVMLFRDFAVGALRDVAASRGVIIAAGFWGKLKTLLQVHAICFLMFDNTLVLLPYQIFGIYGVNEVAGAVYIPAHIMGNIIVYIATLVSLYSGFVYFQEYLEKMRDKE